MTKIKNKRQESTPFDAVPDSRYTNFKIELGRISPIRGKMRHLGSISGSFWPRMAPFLAKKNAAADVARRRRHENYSYSFTFYFIFFRSCDEKTKWRNCPGRTIRMYVCTRMNTNRGVRENIPTYRTTHFIRMYVRMRVVDGWGGWRSRPAKLTNASFMPPSTSKPEDKYRYKLREEKVHFLAE